MVTNTSVEDIRDQVERIRNEVRKRVVGQDELVRSILITLFSGGHILLE